MAAIKFLGPAGQTGGYLLWLEVKEPVAIRFGRFQDGRMIDVGAGNVLYIGSAMAAKGSMSLARRLLRHASRSDNHNPHSIRQEMLLTFQRVGLGPPKLVPPERKRLYWNIDHLLDEKTVHLTGVLIIRSAFSIEEQLANYLLAQPEIHPLSPGLGAHDFPGSTHILDVQAKAGWWGQLPARLMQQLPEIKPPPE